MRGITLAAAVLALTAPSLGGETPAIRAVTLDSAGKDYLPLFAPPATHSFHAGLVILAPGKSVGAHTTGSSEEMLVPLEGTGELRFSDHPPIVLRPGLVTYAPPHTRHDVVNTGSAPLRYIYITAKAE